MSGRSAFGPLFLIALGAVLLYANFHPDLPLASLFADHWPWILVAWGAVRVVETVLAYFHWRPIPPPLGAGAVLLVVLLCILGAAVRAYDKSGLYIF